MDNDSDIDGHALPTDSPDAELEAINRALEWLDEEIDDTEPFDAVLLK